MERNATRLRLSSLNIEGTSLFSAHALTSFLFHVSATLQQLPSLSHGNVDGCPLTFWSPQQILLYRLRLGCHRTLLAVHLMLCQEGGATS